MEIHSAKSHCGELERPAGVHMSSETGLQGLLSVKGIMLEVDRMLNNAKNGQIFS